MAVSKVDAANQIENQLPQANIANNVNFRNIVINGDMSIAQRGTSKASVGFEYATVDRFQTVQGSLGAFTQSQSTDVPSGEGFSKSLKMDCTTADASPASGDELYIRQRFEGQNLQHLLKGTSSAKKLTLSFWVKSNKTGTYIAELFDDDNSRHINKSYTISSADTWEKKIITYDGDTTGTLDNDSNASLNLNFMLGAGSNFTSGTLQTSWGTSTSANRQVGQVNLADSTSNEWYITGIQLEAGEVASDFEFLPRGTALQQCQRYYEKSNNEGLAPGDTNADGYFIANFARNASNQNYFTIYYKVNKVYEPTVTIYSNSTGTSGKYRNNSDSADQNASVSRSGDTGFVFRPSASTGVNTGDFFSFHWEANSEL